MSSTESGKKSSLLRKAIIGLVVLMIVGVVLVLLAPTLISQGVGKGAIVKRIDAALQGDVTVDRIKVAWFGGQRIEGLHITHPDGADAAEATVDVALTNSLFDFVTGIDEIEGTGTVRGKSKLREDGSLALLDVLPEKEEDDEKKPISLEGVPGLALTLDPSEFTIIDEKVGSTYNVKDLNANVSFTRGGDLVATLTGTMNDSGSLNVDVSLTNAVEPDGHLKTQTGALDVTARIEGVTIPRDTGGRTIDELILTATSTSLAEALSGTINGTLGHGDGRTSGLNGAFNIDAPISSDGMPSVSLASISGHLTGESIPTALIEPMVAKHGIDTARDIGDLADINVVFGGDDANLVALGVTAAHTKVTMEGDLNAETGQIDGRSFELRQRVTSELASALAGVTFDRPTTLVATSRKFLIPGTGEGESFDLGGIGFDAKIELENGIGVTMPATDDESAPREALAVDSFSVTMNAPSLRSGIAINSGLGLEGGTINAILRADEIVDGDGALAMTTMRPTGVVTIANIPMDIANRFVAELPPTVAPFMSDALSGEATLAQGDNDAIDFTTSLNTPKAMININGIYGRDVIRLKQSVAEVTATPALMAAMQSESEAPIRLLENAVLTITTEPVDMLARTDEGWSTTNETLVAAIKASNDLALGDAPGTADDVRVSFQELKARVPLATPAEAIIDGGVTLQDRARTTMTNVDVDIRMAKAGDTTTPLGTVTLRNIDVPTTERVLGLEAGTIANWTGASGTLGVEMRPPGSKLYDILVTPDMAQLAGAFTVRVDETMIDATGEATRFELSEAAATNLFGSAGDEPGEPPALRVAGSVPMTFSLAQGQFPRKMAEDEPFDPTKVALSATLDGGPLRLIDREGLETMINTIGMEIGANAFGTEGLTYELTGRGVDASAEPIVFVDGTISNLLDAESKLSLGTATSNLTAKVNALPTPLVDNIIGLDGLLTSAVGPNLNATFVANDFSSTTGDLTGDIKTASAALHAYVRGEDRAIVITEQDPLSAQLAITPEFSRQILGKLQPILAEIRSTEKPMGLVVSNGYFPLDKDLSRMNADIDITLGAVEIDAGSAAFALLTIFDTPKKTVPGYFEPLQIRIRDGVVRYDQCRVTIGAVSLDYAGEINLATKAVNLSTEVPLGALSSSIKELRNLPVGTKLPMKTTGSFGSLKTELDLQNLAGSLLEGAVESTLGNVLDDALGGGNKDGEEDGDIGGQILDGLFGGGRKKDKPKDDDNGGG